MNNIKTLPDNKLYNDISVLESLVKDYGHKGAMDVLARTSGYASPPPYIDEFLDDEKYLGKILKNENTGESILYPIWREALREIFPNPYYSPYLQIIITGAIGLGKSTFSLAATLYDLCKILHLDNPHDYFKLIKSTEIQYVLINTNKSLAESVLYNQLIDWVMVSPFFKEKVEKSLDSSLFCNKISVGFGSRPAHILGVAVVGAILSEINFQNKNTNQAKDNFTNVLRRMQSRFMQAGGSMPGHIWIDSSKTDEGSFIEQHIETCRNDPSVRVFDYAIWEAKKHLGLYSGETFRVFVGDANTDAFIVTETDQLKNIPENKVINVPIEFEMSFQQDLMNSLRDIAGVSSLSAFNFISSSEKISDALNEINPVTKEVITLDFFDRSQRIIDYLDIQSILRNRKARFIHIDIGLVSDKTGIACAFIREMREIVKQDLNGNYFKTREPIIEIEWVLAIEPVRGHQVALYKLKDFIADLKANGIPIAVVSTDGYQSTNLRQDISLIGIDTELISVDKTKDPYISLRNAILEQRLYCVNHPILKTELNSLIETRLKVDHPSTGSKDLADAVCGAVYQTIYKGNKYRASVTVEDYGKLVDRMTPQNTYELLLNGMLNES